MRRANLLIVIGTLAALAVAAVPASAVPQVQRARFRVTLSGQQTSSWTLNRSSTCGSFTGSGDQSFSYHQSRAVTLLFTRYVHHDGMPWVEIPGSTSGIPVTGTASQHGTLVADTTNPNCVGRPIGPPQAPPASDCGTKHYAGSFDVRWYRPQDYPAAPTEPVPLDTAFFLDEEQPQLPFFHCPFNGPLIMQRLTHALLPEAKVFGPRRHLVLRTRAHKINQDRGVATGVRADSTVSWTMRLTRLG